MPFEFPKPNISKEQLEKFVKDPEIVTLEILFVTSTLAHLLILFQTLLGVCPFPITVTWVQLFVGFLFAIVLGESSRDFPKCAYFSPFSLDWKLYKDLAVPTLVYLGMVTLANVILNSIQSPSSFPTIVSLAVVLHHVSRFFGCGQIYMPIRWISLGILTFGFMLSIFDITTMGLAVFPIALAYALCSATFRAWCLEKSMHVVEGRGNALYNHQVVLGLLLLPIVGLLAGEWKVFSHMPLAFGKLFTWQCWGTLILAGTIPFVKNIIANKLIRKTGQAPWRGLELMSMILLYTIGSCLYNNSISMIGIVSFILVLGGRILGMMDALSKTPDERRRAIREESQHAVEMPTQSVVHQLHKIEGIFDSIQLYDNFVDHDEDYDNQSGGPILHHFSAASDDNDDCMELGLTQKKSTEFFNQRPLIREVVTSLSC